MIRQARLAIIDPLHDAGERGDLSRCRFDPVFSALKLTAPVTESVLPGGVASHFPQTTLKWNAHKLKVDPAEANQLVRGTGTCRKGWSVRGLS